MPERRNIARIISWLTAVILAVVLVVPPCGYYLISYNYAAGSLETEATITAGIITQIISANPGLWEYEQASLKELLLQRTQDGEEYAEVRRIYNVERRLVVEIAEDLHYPVIVRSRPLYDSGVVVGMIEISRSLRPLLVRSGVITLLMTALCVVVFLVLRYLPIRTIEEAEEALRQAKQRYQRIVEDLPDLVCRYKSDTTITFVNDAYAQYFGKTADELVGTSFLTLVPRESHDYILQSIASLTRESPVMSMEHEVRASDGTVRWQLWRDRAFFDATGTMTEIQSIGQDITERKEMEEKLKTLSITDDLTGLYNRRGFYALAEQQMKMARRMKADMVILSADLDNLKEINDTLGHQRGDQAIAEAARAIRESFRASDIIARVGGDEFAVFQIKNSVVDTGILTNRLASKLEQINRDGRNGMVVAMSVGVASFPADSPCTIDEMLDRADKLMYEQKRLKRGG